MRDHDAHWDDPAVTVQIPESQGKAVIYHFAQRHTVFGSSPRPDELAGVAAYRLAMLREVDHIQPSEIVEEGNAVSWIPKKEDYPQAEYKLRADVQHAFRDIPTAPAGLSFDQIVYLVALGSGRIYQCLHPDSVAMWEDVTPLEARYWGEVNQQAELSTKQLQDAAKTSTFEATLKTWLRDEWTFRRITMEYRERRVAEHLRFLSGEQIQQLRVAVMFGGGHNFERAIAEALGPNRPISLVRLQWFHHPWSTIVGINPDVLSSDEWQTRFAERAEDVSPVDLSSFTTRTALSIAISKIHASEYYTLEQQMTIAREFYAVEHPERRELVDFVDLSTNRRQRIRGDVEKHSTLSH